MENKEIDCRKVEYALHLANNITWQKYGINREYRSIRLEQNPKTIWFTGLSGSGKSTLANELEKRLVVMGKHTMLLDGDNIRMGLNRDLGFNEADRAENIRRVAEVSKLMNDAGLIVLTSFISPYIRDRETARKVIGPDFIEVYVSTPLQTCMARDVKGLYKRAKEGSILNFTGISSSYEPPQNPEIEIDTSNCSINEAVNHVIQNLEILLI